MKATFIQTGSFDVIGEKEIQTLEDLTNIIHHKCEIMMCLNCGKLDLMVILNERRDRMNRLTLEIPTLPKYQPQEVCWETGLYNDDCICELCEHYYECSGSEDEEE